MLLIFIGELIIQTATDNNPRQISTEHEYMVCFAKDILQQEAWIRKNENAKKIQNQYEKLKAKKFTVEKIQFELRKWIKENKDELSQVTHYDNVDEKGVFHDGDIANTKMGGYKYDVIHPITKKVCKIPEKGFRFSEETMQEMIKNNDILFGEDETVLIKPKKRIEDAKELLRSVIYEDGRASTKIVDTLLSRGVFNHPKSPMILLRIIDFVTKKDSIILDFFSGSATTAHAVMQLNAEDGGNRKFIMVQLPEPCDEKSEAFKAGYKNICEIGKERIRRAGKQILELSLENLEKEGVIEKYAGKLSEIRSLEEIYGFSGESLSVGEKTSERGNVCSVGSDEKSGGVDSIEYSGRTSERNQRVHSISENSKGVSCRIGDTTIDLRTLELLNNLGYRIKFESFGGDKQNDLFSDNNSNSKTLSTQLSALKSKLSVLTTLDIGFRVLKCDTSNMEDVYYTPDHFDKNDLFKSNIKTDRTAEDLLFQVMLDLGIMLSSKIQTKQIDGKTVYYVEGNYLAACFDEDVTEETITKIAKEKPYYFVMKDSSMANDSVATNFEQIFTTYSPETVRKIL